MSTVVRAECDCGFTGTYTTAGRARGALRRHSCDRHRAARAAAARAQSRAQAIDRAPAPCTHPRARHRHGTRAAYVHDRCRCLPCAGAASAYEAARTRRVAYGTAAFVDATPAVRHLRALSDAGMGWRTAADRAGVSWSAVRSLLHGEGPTVGPQRRARAQTVQAICAVPLPGVHDLGGAAVVDSTGTRRRLQALAALGWSVARVAHEHGLDRQALDKALAGRPVLARTVRAVAAAFDQIGDRAPDAQSAAQAAGISRTRARAAAAGWAPPAAWDEDDLDNPAAAPPRPARPTRTSLDLDEWLRLVHAGEHPARAAQRCGVTLSAVEQAARRTRRAEVLRALSTAA